MKKNLCQLFVVLLLLVSLTACGQKKQANVFTADNEIYTYQKIDPAKTQLIIARIGNIPAEQLCNKFEELNPDIQVIYLDITGGNKDYAPPTDWVKNGYLPDVIISGSGFFDAEMSTEYFELLSENPIIKNYEAAALQRTATDSNIYWLPGPSDINAMMYNKTLFDKYGWQVPATFDEFVALCDQIRADTNGEVEPWNPNAKYSNELTIAMQAFTYEELFAGAENRIWYDDLLAGEAEFSEHMKPYYDVLDTLAEHDILREEHFTYSATTRGKEFAAGKIAMINVNIFEADNEEYDFSLMPFPTTKGELGYLCDKFSCYVGVPVKEHTDKQQGAVNRFIEFFSSPEGQNAYIGNTLKISNLKGVPLNQAKDLSALQPAVDAGHMFAVLEFNTGPKRGTVQVHDHAQKIAAGTMTGAEGLAAAEVELSTPPGTSASEAPEIVATVSEDLTILETSFLIAEAYRKAANADIGLITTGDTYRGNVMRMFAGDLTKKMLTVFKPRSFSNDSALVKVSMSGQQIMDALNNPVGFDRISESIYASDGLKCEVAPWNKIGAKYLSVKLADGSELEMDKSYTVAFWSGTVAEEYIGETLETYEGTWEDIMAPQFSAMGTIAPNKDKRIKLIWK